MSPDTDDRINVFISYSHRDAAYLSEHSLYGFLKSLGDENIDLWSDVRIAAGTAWDQAIHERLHSTDVALVLVSQSFLNSHYCQDIEIRTLLECHYCRMALLPVILSPCEWERHDWLDSRQFLPKEGRTIEEHYTKPGKRKRLFLDIREALRTTIDAVRRGPLPAAPRPRPDVSVSVPASVAIPLETIALHQDDLLGLVQKALQLPCLDAPAAGDGEGAPVPGSLLSRERSRERD